VQYRPTTTSISLILCKYLVACRISNGLFQLQRIDFFLHLVVDFCSFFAPVASEIGVIRPFAIRARASIVSAVLKKKKKK
jgi:hypothetical protein